MRRALALAVFGALVTGRLFADVEIVVVASRIPETTRTTPAVVEVISEEDIEPSDTVLDALSRAPGVRVVSNSPGDASVTMGGFGENGFMRTLVLRDGVPLNRPDLDSITWRSIPLSRVERIEILRGPASAQYGDQAVAGVVNIITTSPDDGLSVDAGVSLDSNLSNTQSLSVGYEESGFGIAADVARDQYSPDRERSDFDMWSTSLAGTAEVAWFSGRLRGWYTPSSYQMPGGLTEEAFEDDPADAVNDDDAIEETEYGAELTPEAVFGALSIRAPVSASVTESEVDFASFPSYYDSALTSVDAAILGSYEAFIGPSLALTPTVGFDYRRARLEVDRYQTEERDSVFFEASLVRNVYAPWGRLRASWRDLVIAEAGVRYEYADLEATSDDDGLDGGDAHSPVVFDAGVTYLPADEIKLSARYGRTFRYPALDEQVSYFGFGTDTLYDDLDPETGHSITLGAEYDDGTAGVSVSPFVTWMTDEIVYDAAAFRNVNAGETLRYGSTVDASYTLGAVTTAAGYRYTRAEVASGANEGNLAPLVPAHSVSGEVSAELPFGFGAGTDVSYTSGYYPGGDEGNDAEMIPGRTTWNARISWTGDFGLTAYFAAKNILDDRTPTNAYYSSFSDATTWYPMPGRTFEAGARWSY